MLELYPPRPKKEVCSRLIRSSIYERRCPADELWWKGLFKSLEDDSKIPAHRRKNNIQDTFNQKRAKKIMSILSFDEPINIETDIKDIYGNPLNYGSEAPTSAFSHVGLGRIGRRESEEYEDDEKDLTRYKSKNVGRINPYLNFFKRRPDRAAIWRELPPLALNEMNLTQKADATTEQIASDFVVWLKSIGGDTKASLDAATIKNMFEIGFTLHAATSLSVQIKEMPSVTKEVALKRELPQASIRSHLRKQLKRDILASTAKDSNIAFGKMLPKTLRCYRLKEDIYHKWIESTRIPQDLATMAAVWQGIEGLRSTRAFCAFLAEHPECPQPEYLRSKGMLSRSFYDNTRFSQDTIDFKAGLAGIETGALTTAEF